jgi:hypothetical protein
MVLMVLNEGRSGYYGKKSGSEICNDKNTSLD